MQPEQTPGERALDLIRLLAGLEPDWRPQPIHYLWAIRIVVFGTLIAWVIAFLGDWLWEVLVDYIRPRTPTNREDVANILVVIVAGVVGTLTALAALGNLYISRRNLQNARASLQQQRELENERAQEDALQSYFEQMGDLLTDHKLVGTDREDLWQLAQAQTFTVLARLNGSRKGSLGHFMYGAGLINRENPIIETSGAELIKADLIGAYLQGAYLQGANLQGSNLVDANVKNANLSNVSLSEADLIDADLREAHLIEAYLTGADLRDATLDDANLCGAHLSSANLSGASLEDANLSGAKLFHADLRDADLGGADLRGADLRGAEATEEQLASCKSLEGATMPDGSKHP